MIMLSSNASKAQELEHWSAFLATLPSESYLALYFQDSVELLERAMRADMCCEPIGALRAQRADIFADIEHAKKERDRIKQERDTLLKEVVRLRSELANQQDEFFELSKRLWSAYNSACTAKNKAIGCLNASQNRNV